MQDHELKALLLETCPVKPGQEARAWNALQARLAKPKRSVWSWIYIPSWYGASIAAAVLIALPIVGDLVGFNPYPKSLATADSQQAGIYATSFYSRSAGAQVVWLNGMEPASDKPTYLDPTTVVGEPPKTQPPAGDPNSL